MRRLHAFLVSRSADQRGPMTRDRRAKRNFIGHGLIACPVEPHTDVGSDLERHYEENQRLAFWALKRYGKKLQRLIGRQEAEQVARCALLHAMRRFNPGKGKFSTYAVAVMRSYFSRAICEEIRQRQPLGMSLDARISHEESSTLLQMIGARVEDNSAREEAAAFVQTWMIAQGRNGRIALEYLMTPDTLEEIAGRYGLTRERIRQIKDKMVREARRLLNPDGSCKSRVQRRED